MMVTGNTSADVATLVVATVAGPCTLGAEPGTDYVYFLEAGAKPKLPAADGNTSRYTLKNIGRRRRWHRRRHGLALAPGAVAEVVSDGATWQSLR